MEDPRAIIAREPMHYRQVLTVATATALNALDGFDVLSISFASPGIAHDWGITRAALGVVLSMELIGMGIGAFLLGNLADRIGRRPTILTCLVIMGIGMGLASIADNVMMLSLFRLFTGLGIGGMLAATGAIVAECSNARRRNLAVAIMAGSIASLLLAWTGRWQSVFEFGALITLCFIPLVLRLVPETIAFLLHKRPANALERINRTMERQGRAPLTELSPPDPQVAGPGIAQLFNPDVRALTILLTLVYFGHMLSFYFFVKWIPKIIVDMGFAAGAAGGVLVWANVGGMLGSLGISLLSQRFSVRRLVAIAMFGGAVAICVFGAWPRTLSELSTMACIGGIFTNGATAGLYAVIAQSFPARLRAGGTGLVIGVGRAGAALGPVLAGLLFTAGWSLGPVALMLACGTLIAGVILLMLNYRESAIA